MKIKRLLTSCFGLGWLPVAPGTWGSLPPVIVFGLVCYFGGFGLHVFMVELAFFVAGGIVCLKFSDAAVNATGKKDPREIVTDEIAGQALTFIILSFSIGVIQSVIKIIIVAAAGFALFRLFDIVKPWPIRKLEKLPSNWGILADDLMAGVYAGIVLVIAAKFWILK